MANDVDDYSGQQLVQLVNGTGVVMGDTSGASLSPDLLSETLVSGPGSRVGTTAIGASFKAAAGQVINPVAVEGPLAVGTTNAVNPTFGQATAANQLGVALVTASGSNIQCSDNTWVRVDVISSDGQSTMFYKAVLGAAEAAPGFVASAGAAGEPMMAQLLVFTGADLVAPLDQHTTRAFGSPTQILSFGAKDVAFGDLVVAAFNWPLAASATAGFSDSLNNGVQALNRSDSGAVARSRASSFVWALTVPPPAAVPVGTEDWPYDVVQTARPATGAAAQLTLPAVAGKAYTVRFIGASLAQTGAQATTIEVTLADGANVIWAEHLSVQNAIVPAPPLNIAGLAYRCGIGNSVTLGFAAGVAGVVQRVNIGASLR